MSRALIASLIAVACANQQDAPPLKELPAGAPPALVRDVLTARPLDSTASINGVAFHYGANGTRWMIASTSSNTLAIVDAATGARVRTVGAAGTGMGELRGPAGVVVLGDSIALVVESDNGRVQGFHLPDLTTIGTFGDRLLERPAAITAYLAGNAYAVYVTDNQKSGVARIFQYRLTVGNGELIAIHWRTFGDTAGPGALHHSESIAVDADYDRLLIADRAPGASVIKVYDVDGRFSGRLLGGGLEQFERSALYACANKTGYWIAKARTDSLDAFHMFDRATMARIGVFADGERASRALSVTSRTFGSFAIGAVVVSRADGSLSAMSMQDILTALHRPRACS